MLSTLIRILIPSLCGLACALPLLLILNLAFFKKKLRATDIFSAALLLTLLCGMFSVTGLPAISNIRFDANVNLIPFYDIFTNTLQYILNIALFVPIGLFVPLMWDKYRRIRSELLCVFSLSLFIELSQLLCYRATDIDDLITNTLGGVLGFLLYKFFVRLYPRLNTSVRSPISLSVFIACSAAVMVTAEPFLSAFY